MNSRILKFRAWDSEQKRMYYPDSELSAANSEFNYPELYQGFCVPDEKYYSNNNFKDAEYIIIQQFTGFTDMNEKEIFEGDILNISGEIIVINSIEDFYFNESHSINLCDAKSRTEIIGNIFENSELLNK